MSKLGIDFGTSFSTMCFFNEKTNIPEVIRDENGLDKIPSVVYWGQDGIKVGQAALDIFQDSCELGDENERIEVQSRIFKSVKQEFFPDRTFVLSDGTIINAVDIASQVLKYLKLQAERRAFSNQEVADVCITHPVSFTIAQKNLLTQAAKNAGFSKIELLAEPVAAALGYAFSAPGTVGENILVYDLGGGTLDIALVHRFDECNYHLPIEPLGDADCGGDDFDKLLYDYFEKRLINPKTFCDNPDSWDLKTLFECCKFKEALSRREKATFRIFNEKLHFSSEMSRMEFNALIQSKVVNSIQLLERMVSAAKNSGYQIDTVILIGGSSRIPLIKTLLEEKLPLKPLETMRDDVAVAMGASIDLNKIRQKKEQEALLQQEELRKKQEAERLEKQRLETKRQQEIAALEEQKKNLETERRRLESQQKQLQTQLSKSENDKKAQMENAEVMFQQALKYAEAQDSEQNLAEALILYRKAAEKNHAMAQHNLAEMYFEGTGVSTNYPEALRWYKKAAQNGVVKAMMMLAHMYRNGNGCEINWQEVAQWYEKAATAGDVDGQFETGYGYLEGRGVDVNLIRAVNWLQKAAEANHANAQYYYGLCFEQGRGVYRSSSEAMTWFEKASANGHMRAGAKIAGNKLSKWWNSL